MSLFQDCKINKTKSVIISDIAYSYDQLEADSEKFVIESRSAHLVFIITQNNYDCLVGYYGFIRSNTVVALINNSINETVLNNLILRFKPTHIYQPKNTCLINKNWEKIITQNNYDLFKTNVEIDYKINKNLSMLLMTSGSTGSPEFVRLSSENILSNTKSICEYLSINNNDKVITTLPMSYSYGISIINTHLFSGASLILSDFSLMEKNFWKMIEEFKITTFGGVPYTFEILKKLNYEKIPLPTINYLTQAGGKLSNSLLEYFCSSSKQKNIEFIVMYGQTEASPRMSYLPPSMLESKLGSIGIPIPGGKFSLIDYNEDVIEDLNLEGELIYRGKNVCMGYARDCYDLGKGDLNNGILKTGDIAKIDSDGYYYITGRKKRFLKIFGNRISLDQVEQEINNAGFNCACVGTDKKMKIFTTNESFIQGIQNYINEFFDINKSGYSIIYIDKIPRNDSGKILYSEIEKS